MVSYGAGGLQSGTTPDEGTGALMAMDRYRNRNTDEARGTGQRDERDRKESGEIGDRGRGRGERDGRETEGNQRRDYNSLLIETLEKKRRQPEAKG